MSFLRVQNRNFARDNIAEFDAIASAAKDLADACNAIMERDGSPRAWERFQEAEMRLCEGASGILRRAPDGLRHRGTDRRSGICPLEGWRADRDRRCGVSGAFTAGYRVTRDGRVLSVAHNWRGYGEREMAPSPNSDGYPSVRLTVDGKRTRLAVHRLVARQFLPPRPSSAHEVRHLDGDKTNNHVSNLAWGTPKENADDRTRHGRTSRGRRHAEAIIAGKARASSARATEVRP